LPYRKIYSHVFKDLVIPKILIKIQNIFFARRVATDITFQVSLCFSYHTTAGPKVWISFFKRYAKLFSMHYTLLWMPISRPSLSCWRMSRVSSSC